MANIFVEYNVERDLYRALRNKEEICTGETQMECGRRARKMFPDDMIAAERVFNSPRRGPKKWRQMFGPKRLLASSAGTNEK